MTKEQTTLRFEKINGGLIDVTPFGIYAIAATHPSEVIGNLELGGLPYNNLPNVECEISKIPSKFSDITLVVNYDGSSDINWEKLSNECVESNIRLFVLSSRIINNLYKHAVLMFHEYESSLENNIRTIKFKENKPLSINVKENYWMDRGSMDVCLYDPDERTTFDKMNRIIGDKFEPGLYVIATHNNAKSIEKFIQSIIPTKIKSCVAKRSEGYPHDTRVENLEVIRQLNGRIISINLQFNSAFVNFKQIEEKAKKENKIVFLNLSNFNVEDIPNIIPYTNITLVQPKAKVFMRDSIQLDTLKGVELETIYIDTSVTYE